MNNYEIPKCTVCETKLSFNNFGSVRDINNKVVPCCKNCSESALYRLKTNRLIETYNGCDIYLFEGSYYPYWGCAYSFDTIEGCRARIDNKGVSVVPTALLHRVIRGQDIL